MQLRTHKLPSPALVNLDCSALAKCLNKKLASRLHNSVESSPSRCFLYRFAGTNLNWATPQPFQPGIFFTKWYISDHEVCLFRTQREMRMGYLSLACFPTTVLPHCQRCRLLGVLGVSAAHHRHPAGSGTFAFAVRAPDNAWQSLGAPPGRNMPISCRSSWRVVGGNNGAPNEREWGKEEP